jgi:hypothetical protein
MKPIYLLKLQAAPGSEGIRALRWLLKALLRRYGLRCISVEEVRQGEGAVTSAASAARAA